MGLAWGKDVVEEIFVKEPEHAKIVEVVKEKLVEEHQEHVKEHVKDVKGKLVEERDHAMKPVKGVEERNHATEPVRDVEEQDHVTEPVKDVEEHIVWALCCKVVAVAVGRLDTVGQKDCTPMCGVRRLWEDTLD